MGLQIHWRAPLQPKGFLKIVEFVRNVLAHVTLAVGGVYVMILYWVLLLVTCFLHFPTVCSHHHLLPCGQFHGVHGS